MAADAEKARAANIEQGIAAFGNLATTSMQNMPLYGFGDGLKNMPSDIAGEAAGLGLSQREYMKLNRQNQRALNKAGGAPQFGLGLDSSLGQPVLQQSQFTPPPTPDQFQQYLNTGGAAPDPYGGYGNFGMEISITALDASSDDSL
jgi:hypothetical protein